MNSQTVRSAIKKNEGARDAVNPDGSIISSVFPAYQQAYNAYVDAIRLNNPKAAETAWYALQTASHAMRLALSKDAVRLHDAGRKMREQG